MCDTKLNRHFLVLPSMGMLCIAASDAYHAIACKVLLQAFHVNWGSCLSSDDVHNNLGFRCLSSTQL